MPVVLLRTLLRKYPQQILAGSLVILSALYLAEPEGRGGIAFFLPAAGGLLMFAVGPLVHRPENKRPWKWLTTSGALFLMGLLVRLELLALPGWAGIPDLWTFAGYGCAAMFLFGLLRRTHPGKDQSLRLDTATVTTGAALVGWVMNVAPAISRPDGDLGATIGETLYPVMDGLLLALTVQLALRRGSRSPALQSAVLGLTALLIGDLAYTFQWAISPGTVNPVLNIPYMVAYAGLGMMAAHPSMRELSDVDVRHRAGASRGRLALILLVMLVPAAIPVMLPTHGALDSAVRAMIMVVFGGLVFLRLLATIRAHQIAEAEAQHRATHDLLTGLPNRAALMEWLETRLQERRDTGPDAGWVNVLFVGCDRFTHVNDSWGHAAGDEVLVHLAGRLRAIVPPDGRLIHVGGDEFALRVDTATPEEGTAFAEQVMAAFAEPVEISSGRSTMLTASVGIAQARYGTDVTAQELVRDADLALYQAKSAGPASLATYDGSMRERIARRLDLADALRGALDRGEIHVVYQPIRGGEGYGDIIGWEVLARWVHPDLGFVSPADFIPVAEDTGLIVDIGAFVLRSAAVQLARWQDRFGRPDLHVSVNVSSVQLQRDDVVALVAGVLAETGLSPESLWLEITESVVIDRPDEVMETLNALVEQGVQLCMDDFGTGYSSLSYLKNFRMNILKVDRAFVQHIVEDPRDRMLTKAMIDVSLALGLDGVVAEGVETAEQAAVLEELGCTFAQGYLFGRPLPPDEAQEQAETHWGLASVPRQAGLRERAAAPTPAGAAQTGTAKAATRA